MAVIKPATTALSLVLSLGQQGGRDITKTVSVGGMDVSANADTLHVTAAALAALLEYPVTVIKRYATGIVTE